MPPKPPYLLFAFDVAADEPNAQQIMEEVQKDFPITTPFTSLGVENLYVAEVPQSQMTAKLREVNSYLDQKDQRFGKVLRWMVQLCRSSEIGSG